MLRRTDAGILAQQLELQESEARHGKMLANIGDVIVIIDQNGINRYKSPNVEKWFGWKPAEIIGKSALQNVHPGDIDAAGEFIANLMSKPASAGTTECRYRCQNGNYVWIEFTGVNLLDDPNICGILGNYHDITERKKADERVKESEERLRAITESARDAIIMMNSHGAITYWNPAAETIFGYHLEEAIGKDLHELLVPESRFRTAFPYFKSSGKGEAIGKTLELAGRRKNGQEIAVAVSLSAVTLNGERHAVGIVRDIAEQKKSGAGNSGNKSPTSKGHCHG